MERQRATSIIVKHCTSSLFCSAYLMVLLLLTVHFFQSRISTFVIKSTTADNSFF